MDFFDGYSLERIHKWYLDLANSTKKIAGNNSTAARLLEYYLTPSKQVKNISIVNKCKDIEGKKDGRFGAKFDYTANTFKLNGKYLQKVMTVTAYKKIMKNTIKPIFLSEKDKSKGIVKRIKGNEGAEKSFDMYFYKKIEFPLGTTGKVLNWIETRDPASFTQDEKDILDVFMGLHTYVARADVKVNINSFNIESPYENKKNDSKIKSITVSISSWKSTFFDYYDFNPKVGFSLPNPDYTGNPNSPDKIHPEMERVSYTGIFHDYLTKMVDKGLAKSFYIYGEYDEKSTELLEKNKEIIL